MTKDFSGPLAEGACAHQIKLESTEIQLFAEQEIPWKEIAFASNYFALKRFFENLAKFVK